MYRPTYKLPKSRRTIRVVPPHNPHFLRPKEETASRSANCMKLSRILVVLIFLGVTVYQCTERIRYYLLDPSETKSYYVSDAYVTFPELLACPYTLQFGPTPSVNVGLMIKAYTGPKPKGFEEIFNALGLDGWWNISALTVDKYKYIHHSGEDPSRLDNTYYESIFYENTIYGRCVIIKARSVKRAGLETRIGAELFGDNTYLGMYLVSYAPEEEHELTKYLVFGNGMVFIYTDSWEIYLRASKVIYRNTKGKPCEENSTITVKCLVDCLEKSLFKGMTNPCRLPFMQNTDHMPPCSNISSVEEMANQTVRALNRFDRHKCNCLRKCTETTYSLEFLSNTYKHSRRGYLRIAMFVSEPRISVVEEVATYGLVSLCGDIGGSLGLFLGTGFLQMYDLIIMAFSNVTKKQKSHFKT